MYKILVGKSKGKRSQDLGTDGSNVNVWAIKLECVDWIHLAGCSVSNNSMKNWLQEPSYLLGLLTTVKCRNPNNHYTVVSSDWVTSNVFTAICDRRLSQSVAKGAGKLCSPDVSLARSILCHTTWSVVTSVIPVQPLASAHHLNTNNVRRLTLSPSMTTTPQSGTMPSHSTLLSMAHTDSGKTRK
jgi:hypothetical protein